MKKIIFSLFTAFSVLLGGMNIAQAGLITSGNFQITSGVDPWLQTDLFLNLEDPGLISGVTGDFVGLLDQGPITYITNLGTLSTTGGLIFFDQIFSFITPLDVSLAGIFNIDEFTANTFRGSGQGSFRDGSDFSDVWLTFVGIHDGNTGSMSIGVSSEFPTFVTTQAIAVNDGPRYAGLGIFTFALIGLMWKERRKKKNMSGVDFLLLIKLQSPS